MTARLTEHEDFLNDRETTIPILNSQNAVGYEEIPEHTPNWKAATHSLAIIETYPMSMFIHNNDSQESDEFERIKWEQMADPIPGKEFPITHHKGAEEPPLVQVPPAELPEERINKQMVSWNRADEADLTCLQDAMYVNGSPKYKHYDPLL